MYIVLLLLVFSPLLMAMEKLSVHLKTNSVMASIDNVCWHPDTAKLLISRDRALTLYKITQRGIEPECSLEKNKHRLFLQGFSPQGKYYWGLEMLPFQADNYLHLWSVVTGKLLKTYKTLLLDIWHISPQDSYAICQPDKDTLEVHQISGEAEQAPHIILKDSPDISYFKSKFSVIFSPDDTLIACESRSRLEQLVHIINLKTKEENAKLIGNSPRFNATGTELAVNNGNSLCFYDTKKFSLLKKFTNFLLDIPSAAFLNPDFSFLHVRKALQPNRYADRGNPTEYLFKIDQSHGKKEDTFTYQDTFPYQDVLASSVDLGKSIIQKNGNLIRYDRVEHNLRKSIYKETLFKHLPIECKPKTGYLSHKEKYLILEGMKNLCILDVATNTLLKCLTKPDENIKTSSCSFDDTYLVWHPTGTSLQVIDLQTYKPINFFCLQFKKSEILETNNSENPNSIINKQNTP